MSVLASTGVLTFTCDACFAKVELTADEGHPIADRGACIRMVHELGWRSDKHVNYAWEHYCTVCAELPDEERYPRTKPNA